MGVPAAVYSQEQQQQQSQNTLGKGIAPMGSSPTPSGNGVIPPSQIPQINVASVNPSNGGSSSLEYATYAAAIAAVASAGMIGFFVLRQRKPASA